MLSSLVAFLLLEPLAVDRVTFVRLIVTEAKEDELPVEGLAYLGLLVRVADEVLSVRSRQPSGSHD
jgi:hypothetical protein